MSIASEITSIGENLKKDYQSIANLGADLTNVDKNIENIAELLDGVYDNLPKTEYQEGTEVTLSNTLKGKLDYDNGVVGIGQTEQESTQGYNLVGLKDSNGSINGVTYKIENGVITLNDTATSNISNFSISEIISNGDINFNNNTHKIKWYYEGTLPGTEGFIGIDIYYYNYLVLENGVTQYNNRTIHNGDEVKLNCVSGTTFNNFKVKLLINEGTTLKDWEQYTGGQASPNPSYPQEVKYARGRNLYNKDKTPENYYIDGSGGKVYVSNNDFINQEYSLRGAVTISFSSKSSNSAYVRVCEYNGSTFIKRTLVSASGTYPLSTNCDRVIFSVDNSESVYFTNLQIEQGTQATPYLPYNTIEEVVSGKNLFDNVWTNGIRLNATTGIEESNTNSSVSDYIPINFISNPNYYLSGLLNNMHSTIWAYNSNKQGLHRTANEVRSSLGLTSSSFVGGTAQGSGDIAYIRINMRIESGDTGTLSDISNANMQLEQGSSATTYEPYITPTTYQLSLGDIELNAIGNYKDELIYDVDEDKVYKNEKIGEITLGSEDWSKESYGTNTWLLRGVTNVVFDNSVIQIMTPKFKGVSQSNRTDSFPCIYTGGRDTFFVRGSNLETLEEIQTAMNGQPIYIVKATPTLIEITDTTLINQVKALYNAHSLNGTTIITSNGNLPMIIKCRGLKGES